MATRLTQTTGRQRRESKRPSGKSNKTKATIAKMIGPANHAASQTITSPPGREPGLVTKAYRAYS
ncbi:MAG TPA: hypothetical protein VK902_23160 [Rubrobacter sp.]|nr:hypothetical protein [Rubrobacter sp.]